MAKSQAATARARPQSHPLRFIPKPSLAIVPMSKLSPRARFRRKRLRLFVVGFAIVIAIVGVLVAQVAMTQGQYRLQRLEQQAQQQEARYERLRLEIAALESPERITAVAKDRFGMIEPAKVTYLVPVENEELSNEDAESSDNQANIGTSWSEVKRQLAINP